MFTRLRMSRWTSRLKRYEHVGPSCVFIGAKAADLHYVLVFNDTPSYLAAKSTSMMKSRMLIRFRGCNLCID